MASKNHHDQDTTSRKAHGQCHPEASWEGGSQGGSTSGESVHLFSFLSREEQIKKGISVNNQSEALKQICRRLVIQVGGSPCGSCIDPTQRLYDEA